MCHWMNSENIHALLMNTWVVLMTILLCNYYCKYTKAVTYTVENVGEVVLAKILQLR